MGWLRFTLLLLTVTACDQRADPPDASPPAATSGERARSTVETVPVSPSQPREVAFDRPLLWRVTHPDVTHASHLFGTVHADFAVEWDTLPADVRDALDGADVVLVETEPLRTGTAELAARMLLPQGKTLRRELGKEDFLALVDASGMPPEHLTRVRPWVAHAAMTDRWSGTRPLDQRIVAFARDRDKTLVSFDTPEEQARALDRAITVDVLRSTIRSRDEQREALDRVVEAYRAGDIDTIRGTLFGEATPDAMTDVLFTKRNERWLPTLRDRLETSSTFVSVGAGHLIGPDNLVDSLRDEGWEINRVTASPEPANP